MRTRFLGAAAICLAGLLARPEGARADPPTDQDKARALFKDARALVSADKYADACPKFEESLKLDVGIGTKFNLADCLEHVAKPLAAQKLFLDVADLAHAAGQREREDAARARAAALDKAIPRLVIDVKVGGSKLEIRRDGAVVEPKSWGAPAPVDPGTHEVEASAAGMKTWSTKVDVALAASPVTVTVPELQATDAKAAAVVVLAEKEPESPPATPPLQKKAPPPPQKKDNTVSLVLYAGVGTGAVLTGASLLLYKLSNDQARAICPASTGCTTDEVHRHESLVSDAQTMRGVTYVGLGLMGASLITAGVLSVVGSPRKEGTETGISAGATVDRHGAGAEVMGRF